VTLQKGFLSVFCLTLIFQVLVLLFFVTGLLLTGKTFFLQEQNFLNWDAIHYQTIRDQGYSGFLVAFFPLFPFVWKLSHLGAWGISIANALIYMLSFSWIVTEFGICRREQFLLQSLPSMIFMFIPFTESLFFFCCTLILIGLHRDKISMAGIGFLLSSLCRPTTYVFLPAVLIVVFLCRKDMRSFWKQSMVFSFLLLLGLFITVWVHFYFTGKWFVFFEAQKGWNNSFRMPHFPLSSWAGNNIGRLDGTAFFCGMVAAGTCLYWIIGYLRGTQLRVSPEVLFSVCYLAGISLVILMFRGGSLFSLNRFVFATPFFLLAAHYFIRHQAFSLRHVIYVFFGVSLFWLLFGSYVHIQALLKFEALTLYMLLPFLIGNPNKWIARLSYTAFVTGNALLQAYFLFRFLGNQWVG
jgi:hypothetical protein